GRGARPAGAPVPPPPDLAARLLPAHQRRPAPRPHHQRHRSGQDRRHGGARVVPPQHQLDRRLPRDPRRTLLAAYARRAGARAGSGPHHPADRGAGAAPLARAGGRSRRAHEPGQRDGGVGTAGARVRRRGVRGRALPAACRPVPQARAAGPGRLDADLEVLRGEVVAIVGPSGAGKTTLVDLLPRFYEPTGGQILMDGVPVTRFTRRSLRALMGIVSQETVLLNDTVYANIAYGRGDFTL